MMNKKCPICSKDVVEKYKPFCSKRCADVDLGKWLSESYTVEAEENSSLDDSGDEENNDI